MESDQISIEQLNISFGDSELHDSEARVEQETLSDLWQSFRADRGEEDTRESRSRANNGRIKQLAIPKLTARKNSGSSLSSTPNPDLLFPTQERKSSTPRCESPGLRERRASEPRKLLSIEKFVALTEGNGRRTNISHGKARDSSLINSTQQLTPAVEHAHPLGVNPLLLSAANTDSAAKSYEKLTKITSRSESGFANKSLPPLDTARNRRFSAPSSPSNFTRKEKHTSAKLLQIAGDTLPSPARKTTLTPLSSEGTPIRKGRDAPVFTKKRQEKGRHVSADNTYYISPDDFRIPLGTKIAEQLETELSLIKGQNSSHRKKSRYNSTTQNFQDIVAAEGLYTTERKQLEETSFVRRSLRSSNQTCNDMFDPMFES